MFNDTTIVYMFFDRRVPCLCFYQIITPTFDIEYVFIKH